MGDKTAIMIPDERLSAENILGVDNTFVGTIFVEDQVASDLLMAILVDKAPYILKKYTVDVVGGESNITPVYNFSSDSIILHKKWHMDAFHLYNRCTTNPRHRKEGSICWAYYTM